ncbi:MAG: hypothetical protein CVV13_00965 [Gammaproteobacteria bacterium HGW-Gammaproteobacteria-3]|jgi:uncharacterized coiled-coil protein SlyX|nr:MAG: hypothetical protein CVV13_00965 [Gammaproteobacteria bacterium HGW-Gammaproteobacteria-3]
MDHNTEGKSELFEQLAELEQKVSTLSSELITRSETIALLERSLSEKQSHISELEAALRVAQQSMLNLAWDSVQHYRQQIKVGISRSLTEPKFVQLMKLLELIRSFPAQSQHFAEIRIIEPGRRLGRITLNTITAIKSDSVGYWQNTRDGLMSKCRMSLQQLNAFFARFIEEAQTVIDTQVLWPAKNAYEDIHGFLHEAPAEAKFLLLNKIVTPAWHFLWALSAQYHKIQVQIQSLIAQLKDSAQPSLSRCYDHVNSKIKHFKDTHSFGAPNHPMSGTYA